MTPQVLKWKLGGDVTPVALPTGAVIRHVACQGADPFPSLWVECDLSKGVEPRVFLIFGTGHSLPEEPLEFIGTALTHEGEYVWHVYERHDRLGAW